MKKLLVVVVLTVSLGLVSGVFADQASAFAFPNIFGGGKTCGYAAPYCGPYYYGFCAPAWGCPTVYKKKRAKAAAPAEKKAKPAPAKKK